MSKTLTISQRSEYNQRKRRIQKWCGDRFQIGDDLLAIRDKKLYIDDYGTFEECCETEFGLKRSQSYRLMDARNIRKSLEISKSLSPKGDKIVRPSQALALKDVPATKRAEVVEIAAKTGSVTAKSIAAAAKTVIKDAGIVIRDDTGYIVPPRALPFWNRKGEIQEVLDLISSARCALRKFLPAAGEESDRMFVETNLQSVVGNLNTAYSKLEVSRPYAVCPSCQGQVIHSCNLCKGRGVVSKFKFRCVPEELIEIRSKSCKK